ncbi:MAG: hypothetical protein LBU73_02905 [Helicobacteraceae bacterium]|jgi:predicted small secreted protein|nr:hypothetical protein [Helicobacteraceae bacterium]
MKRFLIAILLTAAALLATACQNPNEDYKVYGVGETARFDNGKCLDMKGNLLSGKAEVRAPNILKDVTVVALCIDGEVIETRGYDKESGKLLHTAKLVKD